MNSKILVVDDEKGIVTMLKNFFEAQNYQVYCAYSGIDALNKISHQAYLPKRYCLNTGVRY